MSDVTPDVEAQCQCLDGPHSADMHAVVKVLEPIWQDPDYERTYGWAFHEITTVLDALPDLLRADSPAGDALRERLRLAWAEERGAFDDYGWMGEWLTSPDERTHVRRWLQSDSITELNADSRPGCCTSCGGMGSGGLASASETNGMCADCLGTGHPHDGDCSHE